MIIMKKGAKSPVWQYFGYRVDDQGKLMDRDLPTCVLCKSDITSKGGNVHKYISRIQCVSIKNYVLLSYPALFLFSNIYIMACYFMLAHPVSVGSSFIKLYIVLGRT